MFLVVSVGFYLVAGDGRFADGVAEESLVFLLRAWVWPAPERLAAFILLGAMSGAIGYTLSAAYRMGNAATVSSYEYTALPMAIIAGWLVFGEVPDLWVLAGTALIAGAGIYIFMRERSAVAARSPPRRPVRRL